MENSLERFGTIKNLTKQELIALGNTDATTLMDDGMHDATELAVSARKALEYLGAFMKSLDSQVIDEIMKNNDSMTVLGSTLELGSTGDRYDYERDTVFKNLQLQLKARQELLKNAMKSDVPIADSDGAEVPKVGIKSASRTIIKCKL